MHFGYVNVEQIQLREFPMTKVKQFEKKIIIIILSYNPSIE